MSTSAKPQNDGNTAPNASKDVMSYDPEFTDNCIKAFGPKTSARSREVFSSLFRHIHDFAREVNLTTDEWMAGQELLNRTGELWANSNHKRNEMHRLSDIFGLESLVDEMAHKHMAETDEMPTSSSILGPFWSPDAPWRDCGASIIDSPAPGGLVTLTHGKVIDAVTGKGIENAVVDIWQASTNGKYDFQDPDNQSDNNLRGKFRTNKDGEYHFYCLRPTAYSLPTDGPAGVILNLLDRHPMRPAHIHVMVSGEGYKPCTTQIYPDDDPYLTTDSVFAVKDDLVVNFKELKGDDKATRELVLNLCLAPKNSDTAKPYPVTDAASTEKSDKANNKSNLVTQDTASANNLL